MEKAGTASALMTFLSCETLWGEEKRSLHEDADEKYLEIESWRENDIQELTPKLSHKIKERQETRMFIYKL